MILAFLQIIKTALSDFHPLTKPPALLSTTILILHQTKLTPPDFAASANISAGETNFCFWANEIAASKKQVAPVALKYNKCHFVI